MANIKNRKFYRNTCRKFSSCWFYVEMLCLLCFMIIECNKVTRTDDKKDSLANDKKDEKENWLNKKNRFNLMERIRCQNVLPRNYFIFVLMLDLMVFIQFFKQNP